METKIVGYKREFKTDGSLYFMTKDGFHKLMPDGAIINLCEPINAGKPNDK